MAFWPWLDGRDRFAEAGRGLDSAGACSGSCFDVRFAGQYAAAGSRCAGFGYQSVAGLAVAFDRHFHLDVGCRFSRKFARGDQPGSSDDPIFGFRLIVGVPSLHLRHRFYADGPFP